MADLVIPAWLGVVLAVLGVAVGVLGAHYTLGNKITQALTELTDVKRRLDILDGAGAVHLHSRKSDRQ